MKVNVNSKIEDSMKKKFEHMAKMEDVSYSDIIRIALFEYLQKYEVKNGKIALKE